MELTQVQSKAIASKARYKVYNYGRRSGKTTLMAYEALGTALTIDNAQVTYYAQTFGDARDIAWDIFLEVFGDAVIKKNETLLEISVQNLKGGISKVALKGWESVATQGKGRGTENDLLLMDEVAFCRGFMKFWDIVLDPTLLTTKGRAVFSSTPNGFNDFYLLSQKAMATDNWEYFHATSYDNPHNDKKWLDDKREEITEDRFSQEYLADFRRMEGLIYKEFDRAYNVYSGEPKIDIADDMAGLDFGYVHPAALIDVKRDRMGHYWVTEEWFRTGKTDAEIAEYVASKQYGKVYPDPAQPQGIKELQNLSVKCVEVVKGKDSVRNGIQRIRDLLNQNKLHINADCVNLIYEFDTYAYKEDGSEEPIKDGDDGLDALRYVIMMNETRVAISNVSQEDRFERMLRRQKQSKKGNPAR